MPAGYRERASVAGKEMEAVAAVRRVVLVDGVHEEQVAHGSRQYGLTGTQVSGRYLPLAVEP